MMWPQAQGGQGRHQGWKKQGTDSPAEPPEGVHSYQVLDFQAPELRESKLPWRYWVMAPPGNEHARCVPFCFVNLGAELLDLYRFQIPSLLKSCF